MKRGMRFQRFFWSDKVLFSYCSVLPSFFFIWCGISLLSYIYAFVLGNSIISFGAQEVKFAFFRLLWFSRGLWRWFYSKAKGPANLVQESAIFVIPVGSELIHKLVFFTRVTSYFYRKHIKVLTNLLPCWGFQLSRHTFSHYRKKNRKTQEHNS